MTLENDPPIYKNIALVAFGSNRTTPSGDLRSSMVALIGELNDDHVKVEKVSPLFRTPAFPKGAGPDYTNGALELRTDLTAEALLAKLHQVEKSFGRERILRWGPRTLDLDLIFYNNEIAPSREIWQYWAEMSDEEAQQTAPSELILPHPRAHKRAFVLTPLLELQSEYTHPVLGLSVRELWEQLPEDMRDEVQRQ